MKKPLGLALSGGGVKCIAHAGVLEFLNEQNLSPEIIACTSAGAIVACLYAQGKSPTEILEFFQSVYFFNWRHLTIKKPGIVSAEVFKKYLSPIFGNHKIKDLGIEIHIVATDIISGEEKTFCGNTKIVDAIIASSCFPGVAAPYCIENSMYSDGGILNNFPADKLKDRCEKMIGVYLSPPQVVVRDQLKTIRSVASRAYDLFSHRMEIHKFSYCDWFICPQELSNYSTFETNRNKMEEIFDIGYHHAKSSFPKNDFVGQER